MLVRKKKRLYHHDLATHRLPISGPRLGLVVNIFELRGDCSNITGTAMGLRGDCSGLRGMLTGMIYGDCSNISGDITKIAGDVSKLSGDVSGLIGDVTKLEGDCTRIYGITNAIRGNVSNISGLVAMLSGDVSGLRGDVSKVWGDATGLSGDVSGLAGMITTLEGDCSRIYGLIKVELPSLGTPLFNALADAVMAMPEAGTDRDIMDAVMGAADSFKDIAGSLSQVAFDAEMTFLNACNSAVLAASMSSNAASLAETASGAINSVRQETAKLTNPSQKISADALIARASALQVSSLLQGLSSSLASEVDTTNNLNTYVPSIRSAVDTLTEALDTISEAGLYEDSKAPHISGVSEKSSELSSKARAFATSIDSLLNLKAYCSAAANSVGEAIDQASTETSDLKDKLVNTPGNATFNDLADDLLAAIAVLEADITALSTAASGATLNQANAEAAMTAASGHTDEVTTALTPVQNWVDTNYASVPENDKDGVATSIEAITDYCATIVNAVAAIRPAYDDKKSLLAVVSGHPTDIRSKADAMDLAATEMTAASSTSVAAAKNSAVDLAANQIKTKVIDFKAKLALDPLAATAEETAAVAVEEAAVTTIQGELASRSTAFGLELDGIDSYTAAISSSYDQVTTQLQACESSLSLIENFLSHTTLPYPTEQNAVDASLALKGKASQLLILCNALSAAAKVPGTLDDLVSEQLRDSATEAADNLAAAAQETSAGATENSDYLVVKRSLAASYPPLLDDLKTKADSLLTPGTGGGADTGSLALFATAMQQRSDFMSEVIEASIPNAVSLSQAASSLSLQLADLAREASMPSVGQADMLQLHEAINAILEEISVSMKASGTVAGPDDYRLYETLEHVRTSVTAGTSPYEAASRTSISASINAVKTSVDSLLTYIEAHKAPVTGTLAPYSTEFSKEIRTKVFEIGDQVTTVARDAYTSNSSLTADENTKHTDATNSSNQVSTALNTLNSSFRSKVAPYIVEVEGGEEITGFGQSQGAIEELLSNVSVITSNLSDITLYSSALAYIRTTIDGPVTALATRCSTIRVSAFGLHDESLVRVGFDENLSVKMNAIANSFSLTAQKIGELDSLLQGNRPQDILGTLKDIVPGATSPFKTQTQAMVQAIVGGGTPQEPLGFGALNTALADAKAFIQASETLMPSADVRQDISDSLDAMATVSNLALGQANTYNGFVQSSSSVFVPFIETPAHALEKLKAMVDRLTLLMARVDQMLMTTVDSSAATDTRIAELREHVPLAVTELKALKAASATMTAGVASDSTRSRLIPGTTVASITAMIGAACDSAFSMADSITKDSDAFTRATRLRAALRTEARDLRKKAWETEDNADDLYNSVYDGVNIIVAIVSGVEAIKQTLSVATGSLGGFETKAGTLVKLEEVQVPANQPPYEIFRQANADVAHGTRQEIESIATASNAVKALIESVQSELVEMGANVLKNADLGAVIAAIDFGLKGDVSNLSGNIGGLTGDVSGLSGDATNLEGDATGVYGDLSEIPIKRRFAPINTQLDVWVSPQIESM
jgi:hypothetical protein